MASETSDTAQRRQFRRAVDASDGAPELTSSFLPDRKIAAVKLFGFARAMRVRFFQTGRVQRAFALHPPRTVRCVTGRFDKHSESFRHGITPFSICDQYEHLRRRF